MVMTLPELPYYHAIQQIGHGGTGIVYSAVDERTGYMVAIKMLYKQAFANTFVREKFIEEANRYLYLNHRNIVDLKDFIIRDDAYYLVMEFVQGQSLDQYIRTVTGPVPEEIAAAIMMEVLNAIAFAHLNGVIHLDLKPANIMIADSGDIKVLDFGISVEEGKKEKKIMGSPLYMSPEQVTGEEIGFKTDIYSLGVTLYQMVTGKEPYPADISKEELFEKIKKTPLLSFKEDCLNLSEKMIEIIQKATNKKQEKRFESCNEFIMHLKTI